MSDQKKTSLVQEFRGQIKSMENEFVSALPSHIKPEQFQRVAVTAIQNDPSLLHADRKSLFGSIMKAAQDGLLPDGREGALVKFKTKSGNDWIQKVQWMPMIGGILKKIRQSGELASITAQVVREGDQFDYWIDDDGEHLSHRPAFDSEAEVRLVYALAKTKDGAVYIEVMPRKDIEKVRAASKAKDNGPWVTWWEQMAKKSAMHRLAKRLPISSELVDVVRRDEEMYDFDSVKDVTPRRQAQSLASMIQKDEQQDQEPSAEGVFGSEQ